MRVLPRWTLESPSGIELGGLVLATLALVVPRLPRPTRRAVAALAPPRGSLLATA